MAKNVSILDAIATLADAGIIVDSEAVKELTDAAFKSAAIQILSGNGKNLPGKVNEKVDSDEWATRLFSLAEDFASDFKSDVKNVQGGAVRTVRVVGIDTSFGHLKIELKSE